MSVDSPRAAQPVGEGTQLAGRGDHDHLVEVVIWDPLIDRSYLNRSKAMDQSTDLHPMTGV